MHPDSARLPTPLASQRLNVDRRFILRHSDAWPQGILRNGCTQVGKQSTCKSPTKNIIGTRSSLPHEAQDRWWLATSPCCWQLPEREDPRASVRPSAILLLARILFRPVCAGQYEPHVDHCVSTGRFRRHGRLFDESVASKCRERMVPGQPEFALRSRARPIGHRHQPLSQFLDRSASS